MIGGALLGATIGLAREASNEAIRKSAEDLAKANDLIAQKQRALAAILAAGFSEQEMRRISLDALRKRFCGFLEENASDGSVNTVPGDASLWN